MTDRPNRPPFEQLPLVRRLEPAYALSWLLAALIAAAAIGGLLFPRAFYPTQAARQAFLPNDFVNLLVGAPILLLSMALARRGRWIGLLCWPGALLYHFYNFIAYVVGLPLGWLTIAFASLVSLSAYLAVDLLLRIDRQAVTAQLAGSVPERFSGAALVFFGVAFALLAAGVLVEGESARVPLERPEIGVAVADIVLSAVLILGGVLLFKRKALAFASGLGLLFTVSALFFGLILIVLLQPALIGLPFAIEDLIVLAAMGLVCSLPTVLYARGVMRTHR